VTGLYEDEKRSGRLEGKVDGNLLSFEWRQWNYEMQGKIRETRGKGIFQYIIEKHESSKTKDYTRIAGWWGYSGGKLNNRWNAVKLSQRSKKRLKSFKPNKVIDQETEYQGTVGFPEEEEVADEGSPNSEPSPSDQTPEKKGKEADSSRDNLF
jgi:hypothetical protein